ncbi:uncharacterized protein [Rutidosis leptorrhynchoides]|uniref:uncharacterized protein isoform X2 n=1 Tax=Rutidosis leptorrhynchoides TaxID=125765 RepID=UPI003A99ED33
MFNSLFEATLFICFQSIPSRHNYYRSLEIVSISNPQASFQFVTVVLQKKYPQFGQLHNGSFMQQDAEECLTQISYTLSQTLRSPNWTERRARKSSFFFRTQCSLLEGFPALMDCQKS